MLVDDDEIEVIAFKDNKYWKTIMTFREWKKFPRKKGFRYIAFEVGFSQFNLENTQKQNKTF